VPEEPEEPDDDEDPDDFENLADPEDLPDPDEDDDEQPLFGRFDSATLLAVEGANGGEWAGLGQVLATFERLFGELPEADGFAESCGLLCDAGLVEFVGDGLDLSPAGRKLLRRAGRHGSVERPAKVLELLGRFDEDDLGEEGAVETPTADAVAAALEGMTDDISLELGGVIASNEARRVGTSTMLGYGTARPLDVDPLFGSDGSPSDAEEDEASWPEDLDDEADREDDWSPDVD
jgi:hypothetical protein